MRIQKVFKTGIERDKGLRSKFRKICMFIQVLNVYTLKFFSFSNWLISLFTNQKEGGDCNSRNPTLSLDPPNGVINITISWLSSVVSSLSCMFKNLWSTPNTWWGDHNHLIIMILSGILKISHPPTYPHLIKLIASDSLST